MARVPYSDMGTVKQRIVNTTMTMQTSPRLVVTEHRRFPGKSHRLTHATATIFKSGKIVIVGAKNEEELKTSVTEAEELFGPVHNVQLRNVVGSLEFSGPVSLEALAVDFGCNYNPDIFNGLVVKLVNGATCMIYHSGKAILTGCSDMKKHYESINIIKDVVETELWRKLLQSQMLE